MVGDQSALATREEWSWLAACVNKFGALNGFALLEQLASKLAAARTLDHLAMLATLPRPFIAVGSLLASADPCCIRRCFAASVQLHALLHSA